MEANRHDGADVLADLPDLPRWLHARGLLLTGRGHVVHAGDGCWLVCSRSERLAVPVTLELSPAIDECVQRETPGATLLLQDVMLPAARYHLPEWDTVPLTLYTVDPEQVQQWPLPWCPTAPIDGAAIEAAAHLPSALRLQLLAAVSRSPVWAASVDERPMSFAWAPIGTEGWYDVSVCTLDEARGRGLGRSAVMGLVASRLPEGLRPVLSARGQTEAAHRLARGLGFDPVDQLWEARRA